MRVFVDFCSGPSEHQALQAGCGENASLFGKPNRRASHAIRAVLSRSVPPASAIGKFPIATPTADFRTMDLDRGEIGGNHAILGPLVLLVLMICLAVVLQPVGDSLHCAAVNGRKLPPHGRTGRRIAGGQSRL